MAASDLLLDAIEIPVSLDTPLYTERVILDGREYVLRFDWNGREGRWYLGLETAEGSPLYRGIKIVADWPLFRRLVSPEAPIGMIVARDITGRGEAPGFGDLGRRVKLYYYPIAQPNQDEQIRKVRVLFFRRINPLAQLAFPGQSVNVE